MLKRELEKSRRLEEIVQTMSSRISRLLEDLSQDNSLNDVSEDFRVLLQELEQQNSLSVSLEEQEQSFQFTNSLDQDWAKIIDFLEIALRSFREQTLAAQREATILSDKLATANRTITLLAGKDG